MQADLRAVVVGAGAERLDPAQCSRELGLLLVETGRYEESIDALDGLLDRTTSDDSDVVVRHALAKAYLRSGRPMMAMTWLEPESREESHHAVGYAILGEAALRVERHIA